MLMLLKSALLLLVKNRVIAWLDEKTQGKKTTAAALGLVCLAVYQLTAGQPDLAFQSFLAALAAFGLGDKVSRQGNWVEKISNDLGWLVDEVEDKNGQILPPPTPEPPADPPRPFRDALRELLDRHRSGRHPLIPVLDDALRHADAAPVSVPAQGGRPAFSTDPTAAPRPPEWGDGLPASDVLGGTRDDPFTDAKQHS